MIPYRRFGYIRIGFYVVLFTGFALLPVEVAEKDSLCIYYHMFHVLCPGCGITRAFTNFMHLDFTRAFSFNPVFTAAIAPACILLFLQDIIVVIWREKGKRYKSSVLEYLLSLLGILQIR